MFGANKPTFGGASTTFGSTTGGSMFGQNKPSLFGQNSTNTAASSSLFGQKSTTNLFGSPSTQQQPTSLFGSSSSPANTNSLFGQNKSLFGGATTQNANTFGTTTNTGGGLFGSGGGTNMFSGGASTAPSGTTVKFVPVIASDTMMKNQTVHNIQTKNFVITSMKEYESKSLEELRVEDYIAGRKAPTAGATSGMFGMSTSAATTGTVFGNAATQNKSLFGGTTTTFGGTNTGGSLFGQTQQPQQQTSLFGSKPQTGGLFGSAAPTFGSQAATSTAGTGLFGASTTTTSTFGQPAAQTQSVFGNTGFGQQQQPAAGTSLFGNTGSTFGQTGGTSLFGGTSTATTGQSLFGKPATTQAPAFGGFGTSTTNTGTSLFGNANKPTGLFGSQPQTSGTSLFGSQPAQAAGGGLFGSTAAPNTGLFGQQTQAQGISVAPMAATANLEAPPIVFGLSVDDTQVKMALIEANLAANPYGNSPLLKLVDTKDTEEKPNPTSSARQMRFLASKMSNQSADSPVVKTSFLSPSLPVAGAKLRSPAVIVSQDLNYKSVREPPSLGKGIGNKSLNGSISLNSSRLNGSLVNKAVDSAIEMSLNGSSNQLQSHTKRSNLKQIDLSAMKDLRKSIQKEYRPSVVDELATLTSEVDTISAISPASNQSFASDPRNAPLLRQQERGADFPRLQLDDSQITTQSEVETEPEVQNEPPASTAPVYTVPSAGVELKNADYYCEPSIKAMNDMVVNGKVVIPDGLTIGRASYGSVFWKGPIELSDIALDDIVIFRHKEVTVYPDDTIKPPVGEGLNRPAEVTLERVWYVDKKTKQEVRDPLILSEIGWRDRVEKATQRMGAIFVDYRAASGSWVFKVDHFSKYGLLDDDEDDVPAPPKSRLPPNSTLAQKPALRERQIQSKVQRQSPRIVAPSAPNGNDEENGIEFGSVYGEPIEFDEAGSEMGSEKKPLGLGGQLSMMETEDDYGLSDMEENDDQQPPEKKVKTEDLQKIIAENQRLLDTLMPPTKVIERPLPKCIEPVREFTGGAEVPEILRRSTLIDAANCHGTTSRMGWSTGGYFVTSLQPTTNEVYLRRLDWAGRISPEFLADMLENNVRFSRRIERNTSVSAKLRHHELDGQTVAPRIKPTNEHAQLIDSFVATTMQSMYSEEERVWKLCQALFPENQQGRWSYKCLEDVGDWLRHEVAVLSPRECSFDRGGNVFAALCRGQLADAIDAAYGEKLSRLTTILTAVEVDPLGCRSACQQQIKDWVDDGSVAYIETNILKIYLILAGQIKLDTVVNGKKISIDCLSGLCWKECLGLFLWWLESSSSLEQALDAAFKAIPVAKQRDDILYYNLLTIAKDQTHSVECVLDAAADFCPTSLDSHLSWHLWTMLRAFGLNTVSLDAEQRLHIAYSEQLLALNLPHLALFVLSHISNNQTRCDSLRECLYRIAPSVSDADYLKIKELVELPKSWIAAAKLVLAETSNNPEQACELALQAGDYPSALKRLVEEVAPNLVLTENFDELRRVLDLFKVYADQIPGWGLHGQIFVEYMQMKDAAKSDDEEQIVDLVSSIADRLQAGVFHEPLQRLCAQTIALEMFEAQRLFGNKLSFELPLCRRHIDNMLRRLSTQALKTTTES